MRLQGHQVDTLIGRSAVEPSNFTYWVPPPPPADAPGGPPSAPNAPPRPIKVLLWFLRSDSTASALQEETAFLVGKE